MREGALALGANKWRTIATVIVPAASKGIMTGMILGVARISGETAPLLFTSLAISSGAPGSDRADRLFARMIFTTHMRRRRLAPPGLGCGPGSSGPGADGEYCCPHDHFARSIAP